MLSDPGSEAQGNPRNMRAVRMPRLLKPARKDGGSLPEARTRVSPETLESQKKPSAIVHEALPQDEKSGPPACEAKYFFYYPTLSAHESSFLCRLRLTGTDALSS
jgi:hypothetical protein